MRRFRSSLVLPARLLLALAAGWLGTLTAQETAATAAPPELGLPFVEHFEPRQYSGHTQVWAAVEASNGVMYFGNFSLVVAYDGARWSQISVPNATFVRGLAVDPNDTLWIGGVNELGYSLADPTGVRTFVSLKSKLPESARSFGDIWRVLLSPKGPIFQTNTVLMRWDGQKFSILELPKPGSWQANRAGHEIWMSNPKNGWFTLTDDGTTLGLISQDRPAEFDNTSMLLVVPTDQPGEFIGCLGRLGLVRIAGGKVSRITTAADKILTTQRPYRAARLPGGRFVISTLQAGALIFDLRGNFLTQIDERSGLPDNTVINVGGDQRGGVWFCMERGMARIDTRPWLSWFGPLNGVPKSALTTQPFQGSLYVASSTGLLRLERPSLLEPARLKAVPAVPNYLFGLVSAGDVLVGLSSQGLIEWSEKTGSRQIGDLVNASAFVPSHSQAGRWFAVASDTLYTFRRSGSDWIAEGEVKAVGRVRSMQEDASGAYWFGLSADGLLRVTFPKANEQGPGEPVVQRFGVADGLPVGHGWVRVMDIGKRLLISCEKGLYRLDETQRRLRPTSEFGPRFADGTFSARTVVEDGKGGTWLAARAAGQLELVTPMEIGRVDANGWRSLRIPQLAKLDDVTDLGIENDVMWISGHSGIIRVDLTAWRETTVEPAPRLVLNMVTTTDGAHLPLQGGWTLPFARRSLRVTFGSPALVGDPQAVYESTLRVGEESTVLVDPSSERSFGALAAGPYQLDLRARGGDGRWSEPVQLAFTVLPPWWFSTWAWLGYATLLGFAVAGGVRQRTRALHRRAERLEAVVTMRTEELRKSNVELARLHRLELDERIAARLAEEKARLEVLRYQLNPHFLFNALTSVRAQLPGTLTGARETIGQLTEFCRSTLLRPASGGHPTLAQEMEMLSAYLAIEKTRWGDLLEVEKTIEPSAGEVCVPPLLLLPLIENALKYGRATSPDTLRVRLGARLEGQTLHIEIANTGSWVQPEERGNLPSLGIGMENLRQRLRRFYPDTHQFENVAADGWVYMRLKLQGEPKA